MQYQNVLAPVKICAQAKFTHKLQPNSMYSTKIELQASTEDVLTLTVLVTTIDALQHFETG